MSLQSKIINWLIDYSKTGNFKFVVGVSGGIDSAVVSTLCAMTGIDTYVVTLPLQQKPEQLDIARKHIKHLTDNFSHVTANEVDLTDAFLALKNTLSDYDNDLGWANSKSRLRMVTLYQLATYVGGIVVGTGNKVEDFGVGFFTKYGDGGVDISPIADLTKTEVRGLAKELGVIEDIILAKPTDGLWDDDRTDEEQIGASYEELEWAMAYDGEVSALEGREKEVYDIYTGFNTRNKHKMLAIPMFINN
ncbi:MAG: NAD(+) synthase [Gammaproteobacteria bacterium]|nr:MAG: NAD(+) synthase [Gammaproteobacteria bacterium]